MRRDCEATSFIPAGVHVSSMHLSRNETHHICVRDPDDLCQEHQCWCGVSFDDPLAEKIGDMLWQIETNYHREGSGPGSRFAAQRLEMVQARSVIRRIRQAGV